MLGELDTYLTDLGIKDFETHEASAHDLPFATGSLDCIFTFNACHHFDLSVFVTEAHRALKPGGRLFLYTRTRTQNAQSVWGVHFPLFFEKETRLYTDDEVGVVLSRARTDRPPIVVPPTVLVQPPPEAWGEGRRVSGVSGRPDRAGSLPEPGAGSPESYEDGWCCTRAATVR